MVFCPKCHDDYPETWKVCPKDSNVLLKSSQIGKYTITAPLGVGGMGSVYRALNPDTQGEVAVKVMHAEVAETDDARKRFKREAAAVAKLSTSHVVKVYDFGAEPDGTMYLVMELLDGHPLRDEIAPPPELMDLARIQFVTEGMLKGLSAAHKAGIVHRDLKPENIFLARTDDGEVPRLIDFGIARIDSAGGATRSGAVTKPGMVMGTAVYMAPEQLEGTTSKVGTWSDVYAVGAMLYEMLGGKTQVKNGTLAEVLIQVRRGKHPTVAELRPDAPAALSSIVQRCLDMNPANRPQTADDLRTALADVWGVSSMSSIAPPSRAKSRPQVAVTQPAGTAPPAEPSGIATPPARPAAIAFAATMPSSPTPSVDADVPVKSDVRAESQPRANAGATKSGGALIFAIIAIAIVAIIAIAIIATR